MFDELKDALLSVTPNVGHYDYTGDEDSYIVWFENSQAESVWANDRIQNLSIQGTIRYFTKDDLDSKISDIELALTEHDIANMFNDTSVDQETGAIVHEWIFEVSN